MRVVLEHKDPVVDCLRPAFPLVLHSSRLVVYHNNMAERWAASTDRSGVFRYLLAGKEEHHEVDKQDFWLSMAHLCHRSVLADRKAVRHCC